MCTFLNNSPAVFAAAETSQQHVFAQLKSLHALEAAADAASEADAASAAAASKAEAAHAAAAAAVAEAEAATAAADAVEAETTREIKGLLAALPVEALLQLPALPLAWAKRLLAAGVRITWAQLLEAARSNVLGVEVWVLALDGLGIQTGIPPAAFAMVRGEDWLALAGADVLGLLQLGLNCTLNSKDLGGAVSRAASATSEAVARLPARLEPAVARSLITTAALRRHPAVSALAGCAAVQEHVYGPTWQLCSRTWLGRLMVWKGCLIRQAACS